MTHDRLLLLDLDGVVVFEGQIGPGAEREILRLHDDLAQRLAATGWPVAVLTHRSRREATRILQAAGIDTHALVAIFAAEDLFSAGLRHAPLLMLRRGLRKHLILPVVRRKLGVLPGAIVFVDDMPNNLDDLAGAGLGVGLHAPSMGGDGREGLTSFDFAEVEQVLADWRAAPPSRRSLAPLRLGAEPWRSTGLTTRRDSGHMFNHARRWASALRRRLVG